MFVLVEWAQASSLLTFTCSLVLVVLYLYGTYAYIGFVFRMQVCTYILYATSRWEFLVFCYFLWYWKVYQPHGKAKCMIPGSTNPVGKPNLCSANSQSTSKVKVGLNKWIVNKNASCACAIKMHHVQEVSWSELLITILQKEEDLLSFPRVWMNNK